MSKRSTQHPRRKIRRSPAVLGLVSAVVVGLLLALNPTPGGAAGSSISGSGSSYVGLAMQQWVADAQTNGLDVNYLPTSSPGGLISYAQNQINFAGTEAEFSALQSTEPNRGYQYVPDVAGAISVMYNVSDSAGRKVDYLHLSRRTIARIFTGDITRWNDQAITDDNPLPGGKLVLPDEPITVIYRSGQSGTTGLFYDFVANVAPDIFGPWAARNQLPTAVRIIELTPGFAPKTQAFSSSDQIAQHVAGGAGQWSIGYDEFGYAKTFGAHSAWVENGSGNWVQPYALNIAEALKDAKLRPDLSQELAGVYNSSRPEAYPISAYSYIVTQCAVSADRPTCKGAYDSAGITETLSTWLRYIACEGQVNMASIGYSPLPPGLSQEVANSVGRLTGAAPEQLNETNCANPTFKGQLGPGAEAPADPLLPAIEAGGGGDQSGGDTGGGPSASSGADVTEQALVGETAAVVAGAAKKSAGGGSGEWQEAAPVTYDRPGTKATGLLPMLLLLAAVLVLPPIVISLVRRSRRP